MPINPYTAINFIDSCAFDPKYDPEDKAAERIFQLYKEGEIKVLNIAHSVKKEIEHQNTPGWIKKRASGLIYTLKVNLTAGEEQTLRDIEGIIAGNGKTENIKEDAQHIFECRKYGSYFIATDKKSESVPKLVET